MKYKEYIISNIYFDTSLFKYIFLIDVDMDILFDIIHFCTIALLNPNLERNCVNQN